MPIIKNFLENPFVLNYNIPDEYFCDRKNETEKIISLLTNGNNIVLAAPRQIGKSSLLFHVLKQKEVKDQYNTVYVDLYGTSNINELVRQLSQGLKKAGLAKGENRLRKITEAIPEINIYGKLAAGPVDTELGAQFKIKIEQTLDKIFDYLEKTSKPNIIVFDEFQRIEEYNVPMAAILRTRIQAMNNTRFVFSGSQQHMLEAMFKKENKPFYKAARPVRLDIIPEEAYSEFCKRMFENRKKRISDNAIHFAYSLLGIKTKDIQELMNGTFKYTRNGECASIEKVRNTLEEILEDNDEYYTRLLTNVDPIGNKKRTEKEKNLLICLGCEGLATKIMGAEMIDKYYLGTSSTIQTSLKRLSSGKEPVVINLGENTYKLADRFFELWIANKCGLLTQKYNDAEKQFEAERNLRQKDSFQKIIRTPKL